MKMLKIGIIGAGGIANKFCAAVRLTAEECGVTVAAVSSKNRERAETFAEKNGIPAAFGSYEEMLDCAELDAVYIATTHNFHADNIALCLEKGKHVLCEKPMTLTAAEADALFAEAGKRNLVLMEAMWSRFLPHVVRAREWIAGGKIGEIQGMTGMIGFRSSMADVNGRLLNPALAGGALYDIGVYPIELMSYLGGEPITDAVGVYRPHPETGVDVTSSVILRFRTFDAVFQCTVSCPAEEYICVYGTKGKVILPHASTGNTAELMADGGRETFTCSYENGFTFEVKEFASLIRAGKTESERVPACVTAETAGVYEKVLGK